MATQCSRRTLVLQTEVWTNTSCLLLLAMFAEPLREQRIGMVMQEASAGSQQGGVRADMSTGQGSSPWPPRGLRQPRAGLGADLAGDRSGPAGPWRPAHCLPCPASPCPSVPSLPAWSPHPAASQPTTAMATLWNFQFSANVWVVTEAQRPWSDIMAEEL